MARGASLTERLGVLGASSSDVERVLVVGFVSVFGPNMFLPF